MRYGKYFAIITSWSCCTVGIKNPTSRLVRMRKLSGPGTRQDNWNNCRFIDVAGKTRSFSGWSVFTYRLNWWSSLHSKSSAQAKNKVFSHDGIVLRISHLNFPKESAFLTFWGRIVRRRIRLDYLPDAVSEKGGLAPGAHFSEVPEPNGLFSGVTIPFVSQNEEGLSRQTSQ